MQRVLVPFLSLIALVVLCFFCIRCHGPEIQADLTERGLKSLGDAGFDRAHLALDGRDAVLAGSAASEAERAEAERVVAATWGVRTVDNRLAVDDGLAAAAEPGEPLRFELARMGDGLALRGAVPSQALREEIVARAREAWGAEVRDELTVDPTVRAPGWLEGLPEALRIFGRRTEDGSLAIEAGAATLGGRVYAETARQSLLDRMEESLPGLTIEDRLELRPPETPEELQETLETAIRLRTVEFATNSAELTAVGRSVLNEVFELLSGHPEVRIAISGHTDDRGAADYNLDLSRRRARAAGDYLVERGLAADRFETAGFGEERPIADNGTPEGRLKNRRIEFQVLEVLQ